MDQWVLISIAAVVAGLVLVAVAAGRGRRRRRAELRAVFGPEYQRAVQESGSRIRAERDLAARRRRVGKLDIRPLEPGRADHYRAGWAAVELDFVDDPAEAVRNAHRLLLALMGERGYPIEDLEQRAADLSVDHPTIVDHYRTASDTGVRQSAGEADTEDLRQAIIHYRVVFEELLGEEREREATR